MSPPRKPSARPRASRFVRADAPPPPVNPRKDLIRLDTARIRKKALATHRKAERDLALLKDQLKRYHEKDIPGFRSWLHRTFGALLTRQRELQQALAGKQAFVAELRDIALRFKLDDIGAYRKWLWRRDHPAEAEAEDRRREEEQRQAREEAAKRAEARAKRKAPDPFDDDFDSDLDDDVWNELNNLFESMFGKGLPRRAQPKPAPEDKSLKELYRTIVRRLHPDHHGQMSEARKALWHEAQAAYRRHDANALHGILARCDGRAGGLGAHSPVSLIQRLTLQLKQACKTTRRDITRLRRDLAWDYERRINDPRYVRRIRDDLVMCVRDMERTLDELAEMLAELEREARREPVRRKPPRPRSPTPEERFLEDLLF
jgi:hypothetical protein